MGGSGEGGEGAHLHLLLLLRRRSGRLLLRELVRLQCSGLLARLLPQCRLGLHPLPLRLLSPPRHILRPMPAADGRHSDTVTRVRAFLDAEIITEAQTKAALMHVQKG